MRILVALGGNAPRRGDAAKAGSSHSDTELAAREIAALALQHEVVVCHDGYPQVRLLTLLQNALPGHDIVTLLTEVVIGADDPVPEPRAIAELRSIRTLIDAGVLVICAGGAAVALDGSGEMHGVEASIDEGLTAALLARRLDADLLLIFTEASSSGDSTGSQIEAARTFVAATEARAAIGHPMDAARLVSGEAGTQVSSPVG
ncbi:MAG: hypothetical protein ACHQCF_01450 [Solirubrobacterales bacterium]